MDKFLFSAVLSEGFIPVNDNNVLAEFIEESEMNEAETQVIRIIINIIFYPPKMDTLVQQATYLDCHSIKYTFQEIPEILLSHIKFKLLFDYYCFHAHVYHTN